VFKGVTQKLKELQAQKEMDQCFIVETKENVTKVFYKDVYYFEKSLRKVKLCYNSNEIVFYGSFKEVKDKLDMRCFTQCHQGYIINNDKISSYKNQQIFIKELNINIPVSKAYIKDVREIIANQIFQKR
jgi:DNA-binding LytR/AlgR family response regulator